MYVMCVCVCTRGSWAEPKFLDGKKKSPKCFISLMDTTNIIRFYALQNISLRSFYLRYTHLYVTVHVMNSDIAENG